MSGEKKVYCTISKQKLTMIKPLPLIISSQSFCTSTPKSSSSPVKIKASTCFSLLESLPLLRYVESLSPLLPFGSSSLYLSNLLSPPYLAYTSRYVSRWSSFASAVSLMVLIRSSCSLCLRRAAFSIASTHLSRIV